MDMLKLEALRLANLPDLSPERVVERAAAFESYLTGAAASAAVFASEMDEGGARAIEENGATCGDVPAKREVRVENTGNAESRRDAEEAEARELLIRRAFDHRRVDVATFMAAGMPEWLARAAVAEMRVDTEGAGFLDKENRLKDWHYFASRYLRMRKDVRAPSVELRTRPQF
ncbi:hypothetical protein PUR21_16515 [Methylorubrum rhodesianum]|uniref:Uncharacterized protein n=1 Tax=Methylorubrum rhodesianum TaxID=29427 RepID=A0ABU9ZDU0_9HYPH